ncbi:MAG TPA: PH domain-containing protein [Jatrophihabitans sp.]|nr:PH domain-containing protein [Jatrophihabitans sp.]
MVDLDQYLISSESLVVRTRRHWASLLKPVSVGVAAFLLGIVVLAYSGESQAAAVLGVVLLLGALIWLAWSWGQWYLEEFIVTDKRVLLVYGVLTRRVGIMPLSKVTDLTYERSLFGRLLGYGAFVVESAGQRQAFNRIEYLPSPNRLYHDVSLLLFPERVQYPPSRPDYPTFRLPPE